MSIAVIGAGIAGTAAAHELARQGERATVFHQHAGASALYSGALDFEPWDRAAELAAIDAQLGQFSSELGVWELGAAAARVATPEGNLRPTRGRDRSLLDLERCTGKRVAVVDLERDDWDALLLARSWATSEWAKTTHTRFEPVRVRALHANFERRTSAYDFAAAHDAPERCAFLLAALRSVAQAPDAWLLGPWLGVERAVAAELSASLGVLVGETTSAPGGAAGARFENARDRLLARVAHVERGRVVRLTPIGTGFRIETEAGVAAEFSSVVLATGGVAAGGIALERSFERRGGTGFRLSFDAPVALELDHEVVEGVSSLASVDFVERGLGTLLEVGIAASADGSVPGNPGLFAAGDAIAGRSRTALVAARSGLGAAQRALEHARSAR
ncbi:MAG TPA: NAD(P)-binding protein [Polyangiaceae bacterium]|nr:NAD(P)-binding protein [Polyangiaceae bacterium]